jgi:hypothetical protein
MLALLQLLHGTAAAAYSYYTEPLPVVTDHADLQQSYFTGIATEAGVIVFTGTGSILLETCHFYNCSAPAHLLYDGSSAYFPILIIYRTTFADTHIVTGIDTIGFPSLVVFRSMIQHLEIRSTSVALVNDCFALFRPNNVDHNYKSNNVSHGNVRSVFQTCYRSMNTYFHEFIVYNTSCSVVFDRMYAGIAIENIWWSDSCFVRVTADALVYVTEVGLVVNFVSVFLVECTFFRIFRDASAGDLFTIGWRLLAQIDCTISRTEQCEFVTPDDSCTCPFLSDGPPPPSNPTPTDPTLPPTEPSSESPTANATTKSPTPSWSPYPFTVYGSTSGEPADWRSTWLVYAVCASCMCTLLLAALMTGLFMCKRRRAERSTVTLDTTPFLQPKE